MAETLKDNQHEHSPVPENDHLSHEKAPRDDIEAIEHKPKHNIENLRQRAEKEAISSQETLDKTRSNETHAPKETFVNKELKDMAYSRTLNRVRQQLSPVNRTFSRFIHQPVVDSLSEGAAKTIGRPSGLFGGGLVALVGTSVYYYVSKHYGYDYNFFVFLILLVGGFVAGWALEILWHLVHPK